MNKKLTIFIPAYDQLALGRRCLDSLKKQSFQDFSVILQDDAGPADYRVLAAEFLALDVLARRHEKNLGAIGNMIACLTAPVETEYIMCLHEDDLLQADYLKNAVNILEKNPDIAFVASPASFFSPGETVNLPASLPADWQKYAPLDFVAYILNGNRFAFGSIIYRSALIKPEFIDLTSYDVFFDRPFLLSLLLDNHKQAAVMKAGFYYYQNHPYPDKRWQSLTPDNVFNLYAYYEKLAPGAGRRITSQYLFDFVNLEHKDCQDWKTFWRRGRAAHLISPRRLSLKFLGASLFILSFGKKSYSQLFTLIKNRSQ